MNEATGEISGGSGGADRQDRNWKRAAMVSLIVLAAGALGLLINGGRPESNAFYSVILITAFAVPGAVLFGYGLREQLVVHPPRTKLRSAARGVLVFTLSAGFFLGFMGTLLGAWYEWPVAVAFGAASGVDAYRRQRGLPYSRVPTFVIGGLFLAVMAVLIVLKLIRKGVITL